MPTAAQVECQLQQTQEDLQQTVEVLQKKLKEQEEDMEFKDETLNSLTTVERRQRDDIVNSQKVAAEVRFSRKLMGSHHTRSLIFSFLPILRHPLVVKLTSLFDTYFHVHLATVVTVPMHSCLCSVLYRF